MVRTRIWQVNQEQRGQVKCLQVSSSSVGRHAGKTKTSGITGNLTGVAWHGVWRNNAKVQCRITQALAFKNENGKGGETGSSVKPRGKEGRGMGGNQTAGGTNCVRSGQVALGN